MDRLALENDKKLLSAFRAGDRLAMGRVYELYAQEVARVLRRGLLANVDGELKRVGHDLVESEFEALMQETFLRAFSPGARDAYDGLRPYGAWIATIARNLMVDRARRLQRDERLEVLDDGGGRGGRGGEGDEGESQPGLHAGLVAGQLDPLTQAEEAQLREVAASTAAQLNDVERRVFQLRFVDGLTQRDVAAAVGLSVITVRRIDARLRSMLLDAYQSRGHLPDVVVAVPNPTRDRTKG